MEEWKNRLAQVDDDYLVGLSNKGIVKRAYKDKQECAAEIDSIEEEAVVKLGGETVTVRFPLGESKCTCPSRSMCRHVVQAILVLRESCLKEADSAPGQDGREASAQDGGGTQGQGGKEEISRSGREEPLQDKAATGGNSRETPIQDNAGTSAQNASAGETQTEAPGEKKNLLQEGRPIPESSVSREVCAYPLETLKKILGSRHLQNLANLAMADLKPEIQYSSVITVKLPDQEFPDKRVVKLLSPLEYSACTCHKKELCIHKAAAILWCQLEAGVLARDGLSEEAADVQAYDMKEVKEAAEQMKAFLQELFSTGLSRSSPDVLDYLERLAIISHNVGLARFEGDFRALSDSYDRYLKRKAAFRTEELMAQMCRLYRRADLLLMAEDAGQVHRQAGEFRAEYLPVGNLDLIGITMEHFQSQTGYEGETVYFLEERTKKWYTYTNARPTFYDTGKKRGYIEKSPAPWGLNVSFENLMTARIHLAGAKCDERRRLSSSQDTKGEVISRREIEMEDIEEWYYEDFGKLFRERIAKPGKWLSDRDASGEGAQLVYVQPDSCAKAEFSQTGQQLSMSLYDKAGREIIIEVTYSQKESGTIRYLEKISQKKNPCFLGKIYLRDGRIRMYPVDVWEKELR